MTITLTPHAEELLQKRLEGGGFSDAGEVIQRALESLEAEESWFEANKQDIQAKIARGLEQLDRGEGIPGSESRARLQKKKADWLAGQNKLQQRTK